MNPGVEAIGSSDGRVVVSVQVPRLDGAPAGDSAMPVPVGPNRVWIQFARSLDRAAQIVPLAMALEAAGWTIPSAAAGGERIAAAAGRSEIRYFHPGDREIPERLAEAVSRLGSAAGTDHERQPRAARREHLSRCAGGDARVLAGPVTTWAGDAAQPGLRKPGRACPAPAAIPVRKGSALCR